MSDPFLRRVRFFTYLFILFFAIWYLLPVIESVILSMTTTPRAITARGDLSADEQSTIEIFENASPSVVYITTIKRVVNLWTRDVYKKRQGTGSGFFWDDVGHVVTNNHVIQGASEALVRLNDGRTYQATLVGTSPAHDLAVLRIRVPINRPVPVPIGTSSDLKVGQKVFAIGNPFGLDYTLTAGIVSALDRTLSNGDNGEIDHLIQTDAAINPGNSGGPLLDSAGRLIGINTAIYSPSGAYAGIGFAVPVDTVNRVIPEIIATGRYTRPSLGIKINQEVSKKLLSSLGIKGVLVLLVEDNSIAQQIGIRSTKVTDSGDLIIGDIILEVGGQKVTSVDELMARLDDFRIGDATTLKLWRMGEEITVDVVF